MIIVKIFFTSSRGEAKKEVFLRFLAFFMPRPLRDRREKKPARVLKFTQIHFRTEAQRFRKELKDGSFQGTRPRFPGS